MTRSPLKTGLVAGLILIVPSLGAADAGDDSVHDASLLRLDPDPRAIFEEPCENVFERSDSCVAEFYPKLPARMSPAWTHRELDLLRQERSKVRLVGPSFGVAFSALGFVAGIWLLAMGVEGARGPSDNCALDETWCISRPAPYAGTVLMGLSSFGLARVGKKLRQRSQKRRHLDKQINELARR